MQEKRHPRLLIKFTSLLLLSVVMLGALGIYKIRKSLPSKNIEISSEYVNSPVHISIDANDIPTIKANTDNDVFFAMGYLHAQDRLWQLTMQKRMAQGRLSELFGEKALDHDIWIRTLSIYPAAESAWEALSDEAKSSLQAYSAGINFWIRSFREYPLEFAMFDAEPEGWTPIDSLAWLKIYALSLSGNYSSEISRHQLAKILTTDQMKLFFADSNIEQANSLGTSKNVDLTSVAKLGRGFEGFANIGGRGVGSNAWAISDKLSGGNGAILAADPHLPLQAPSPWYTVVQKGGRLNSSGTTMVGLPIVLFGTNGKIAWGGTNMKADTQDLFFENLQPSNPSMYKRGNAWESLRIRDEAIQVRANFPSSLRPAIEPVHIKVLSTDKGPLISTAMNATSQPVSLRWAALDVHDKTYEALLKLNHATNWSSFKSALAAYVAPTINMVYADADGNIGLQGIGRIPIRTRGIGDIPMDASDPSNSWSGYIPFPEMPYIFNPPSGYVVSANNKIADENFKYFVSNDWAPSSRFDRIEYLLQDIYKRRGAVSPGDFESIQLDLVSMPAKKMLPLLLQIKPQNAFQQQALEYLRPWNGTMAPDSHAATIFNIWMKHLGLRLVTDKLSKTWTYRSEQSELERMAEELSVDRLFKAIVDESSIWCMPSSTSGQPDCAVILTQALDDALKEIKRIAGADMSNWQWGSLRKTEYALLPRTSSKIIRFIFNNVHPDVGGSVDTVNVSNYKSDDRRGYLKTFGTSFRQIISMKNNNSEHLVSNSSGQSANPISAERGAAEKQFWSGKYSSLLQPTSQKAVVEISPLHGDRPSKVH